MKNFFIIVIFSIVSAAAYSGTKSIHSSKYNLTTIFKSDDVIWSFAFISENELLISLREGKLLYYNIATKKKKLLETPKVTAEGQGGLLDVHLSKVKDKRYVYVTFSEKVGSVLTTSLARGIFEKQSIKNFNTIFQAKVVSDTQRHFGSRLAFVDNYIFMTIGDRGERKYAQNLSYHNGKILRLTLDGKPAKGNPFENKKGALPEIWSYGHRNPQGIDYDLNTSKLFSCEFGPRGGDELNLIEKSKNYGWPLVTYGKEYWGPSIGATQNSGMEQPISHWVPSISPSGMAFYKGDKIKGWKNSLFLANLSATHLRRLVLSGNKVILQEELFKDLDERIRHVRSAKDGYLYYSTDSGKIVKVSNTSLRP